MLQMVELKLIKLNLEDLFADFDKLVLPNDVPKSPLLHVVGAFMGKAHQGEEFSYAIGPSVSNYPLYFGHDEVLRRFCLMLPPFQYAFIAAVSSKLGLHQVEHMLLSVRWEGHAHRTLAIQKLHLRGDLTFELRR